MTQKEQAEELVDKFQNKIIDVYSGQFEKSKECALIAVDEVIKYAQRWGDMAVDDIKEFQELKKEIENL